MWSPFIMQKLISDNRLFGFIQKKKGYLNLRYGKTLKVQKNTFRARGLAYVNYENYNEAAKSILDMGWLSRMPILTLALINSLCLARFSEDDLDCSTVFDHKSFYAVITRPKHKIFFSTCYIISPHALRNANRKVTLVAINNT